MRTLTVIFVMALATIAFGIYSDAMLTSSLISQPAGPDAAAKAVARALKHG
jgi:hypothetical protein